MKGHYTKLDTTHHRMLPRILGAWCESPNKRILSYKDALQRTEWSFRGLFNIAFKGDPALQQTLHGIVLCIWRGGGGAHFQYVCFLRQLRFQGSILTQGDRCSQEHHSRNIIRPIRLMPCPFSTFGFSSSFCFCPRHHEEREIKGVKGLYPAGDSCCQMFHEGTSVWSLMMFRMSSRSAGKGGSNEDLVMFGNLERMSEIQLHV